MNRTPLLSLLTGTVVGLAVVASSCPALAAYSYTAINFPGAAQTEVWGVSGTYAVGNFLASDGTWLGAFKYNLLTHGYTSVSGVFGNAAETGLLGINGNGVMVGSTTDADSTDGFRLTNNVFFYFQHPGSTYTQGRAINLAGLISGFYIRPDRIRAGFVFNPATGTYTDLVPGLVPSTNTIAQGINGNGEIVGSAQLPPNGAYDGSPAGRYGWKRFSNGTFKFFTVNSLSSSGRGLSDAGAIAGFQFDGNTGLYKGFVTTAVVPGGTWQAITIPASSLLVFPGSVWTLPQAINSAGAVAGTYYDSFGLSHGFITSSGP